jgi:alpha-beta hydrolase superfamily lysophospholipase
MVHEYRQIVTKDGQKLNALVQENGCPIWLVFTHGVGEHLERHRYLIAMFSQYFNILLYDLRGHGKSSGKRGHVEYFEDYYADLEQVLAFLKNHYKMDRFILMGHSMGALITAGHLQNSFNADYYPEKVFLSAPPVCPSGFLPALLRTIPYSATELIAANPLSVKLKGMVDLKKLSHDGRVYQAYLSDPLNCLSLHSRLLLQLIKEARAVFSRPLRAKCPLYCAWGSEDSIINAQAVKDYFENIEKPAQTLEVAGGFHELHNEIDKYKMSYFNFLKNTLIQSLFENYRV